MNLKEPRNQGTKEPRNQGITRRDFLKISALFLGTLALPKIFEIGIDESLDFASAGMDFPIPPEFEGVKIPEKNEDYRPPQEILYEAFSLYEDWRSQRTLPEIYCKKGEEYADFLNLSKKLPVLFDDEKFKELAPEEFAYRLYGILMGTGEKEERVARANIPDIYSFSSLSQNGIVDNINANPGSAIINKAEKFLLDKYGWDRSQLISSLLRYDETLPKIQTEDLDAATKIMSQSIKQALEFIEKNRDEAGEPLSVSVLIAYFLYINKGDLKSSMWDATLFLKVLARNDIETLFSNNTFDKAEKLAHLFKDEFSPRISHNWLMEKFNQGIVPEDSNLRLPGAFDNQSGKNFMPINKDGTYYHVINIITWAAVEMDPWVVESIVSVYYHQQSLGIMDNRIEHGADKVEADARAAKAAGDIKRLVTRFTRFNSGPI